MKTNMKTMKFKNEQEVKDLCKTQNRQLMVYNNIVLDVSKFEHPGPQDLIVDNIGKDITKLFDDQEHSIAALDLVENLKIGFI